MTFDHLKTNSIKSGHYRLKIRKVIEFFDFQSLMQHFLTKFSCKIIIPSGLDKDDKKGALSISLLPLKEEL